MTKFFNIPNNNKGEITTIKNLEQKLLQSDLIICKENKNKTITILTITEYTNKVSTLLKDDNIIKMTHDPTNKYQ